MPRKRRTPKARKHDLPVWQQEFLLSGQEPVEDEEINEFQVIDWKYHSANKIDPVKKAWSDYGEGLLQEFIAAYAGRRPYAWWCFDAPHEPVVTRCAYPDGKSLAHRKRLGGVGSPKHEHLNYSPVYRFGIPTLWINQREVEVYTGRAKNKDGDPMYIPHREFTGVAIDWKDPPQFESQSAYLDRHGLLTAQEREALHDDAFQPEIITEEYIYE